LSRFYGDTGLPINGDNRGLVAEGGSQLTKKAKIWLIVGLAAVVLLCCCVVSVLTWRAATGVFNFDDIIKVSQGPASPGVTAANYERVEVGMTYGEVARIFRDPGVRTAQLEMAGKQLEFYTWHGRGAVQVTITFQDGVVIEKDQTGLD